MENNFERILEGDNSALIAFTTKKITRLLQKAIKEISNGDFDNLSYLLNQADTLNNKIKPINKG